MSRFVPFCAVVACFVSCTKPIGVPVRSATERSPSGRAAGDVEKLGFDEPFAAAYQRYQQRLSADGTVPDNALVVAKTQRDALIRRQRAAGLSGAAVSGPDMINWTWLGPGNIGGRLRAIVIHPTQPDTIWVGAASGGIWKTTNAGASWTPLDDFLPSLAIGCLAMDPTNPDVLYAGTGEGVFNTVEGTSNTATVRGAGIFKTTDGGATWNQLPSTAGSDFYFVNRMAIHPTNPQIMLAATGTGVHRTTDGGANWTQVTTTRTLDLKMHPTDPTRLVAGGKAGDARYSTDGGVTWQLATGITGNRVELAYARSNPSVVMALVNASGQGRVYRSNDGGQTYGLRTSGAGVGTLGDYTSALWVDPTNPNLLLAGGTPVTRSTDNGVTLTSAFGSVHVDYHAIVEHPGYNGTTNRTVYFGNDGGIYVTTDVVTNNATALNNNLGVTQFYGAAIHAGTNVVIGGTQDNGTLRYTGNPNNWTRVIGGDGAFCASDPTNSNVWYGETQRLAIRRSTNGGTSFSLISSGLGDAGGLNTNFIPFFMLDPNNSNRMLAAGRRLWRSDNVRTGSTPSWTAIKPTIEPDPFAPPPATIATADPPRDHYVENSPFNISTIAVAEGNADVVWVGHNNGEVWKTNNGTAATPIWVEVDENGVGLPDRWISRIVIDAADHNRVYVSIMGWHDDNVWRTTDAGLTWTRITGVAPAALPAVPVGALALHRQVRWLYAGTDIGLFISRDDGVTWTANDEGPSTTPIDELIWRDARTLMVVGHGRGIYLGETFPVPGDMNCDGVVNVLDVPPFALALTDPAGYAAQYPGCNILLADMNGDTLRNGDDLALFVAALLSP